MPLQPICQLCGAPLPSLRLLLLTADNTCAINDPNLPFRDPSRRLHHLLNNTSWLRCRVAMGSEESSHIYFVITAFVWEKMGRKGRVTSCKYTSCYRTRNTNGKQELCTPPRQHRLCPHILYVWCVQLDSRNALLVHDDTLRFKQRQHGLVDGRVHRSYHPARCYATVQQKLRCDGSRHANLQRCVMLRSGAMHHA